MLRNITLIKRNSEVLEIPLDACYGPTDDYAAKRAKSLEWMRQFGNRKPLQDEEKDNG